MKLFTTLFLLLAITCKAQQPFEGPYLEALVKYSFTINDEKEKPRWGLGFRMDTAYRRYVVIANDGWLTKSEFFYDSAGRVSTEISTQLSTGLKQVYNYYYQWLAVDTLQSVRSDYELTTNYVYKAGKLLSVEKVFYGSACKVINSAPPSQPGEEKAINSTCAEKLTFIYDSSGRTTGRDFAYYYSKFNTAPKKHYSEHYQYNGQGLIDTVIIGKEHQLIIMAFNYDTKGRMTHANRTTYGSVQYESWEFTYKRNGLLKRVKYYDLARRWKDKYRWRRHKWKLPYPVIPDLKNFITSHDAKLSEGFYFGY